MYCLKCHWPPIWWNPPTVPYILYDNGHIHLGQKLHEFLTLGAFVESNMEHSYEPFVRKRIRKFMMRIRKYFSMKPIVLKVWKTFTLLCLVHLLLKLYFHQFLIRCIQAFFCQRFKDFWLGQTCFTNSLWMYALQNTCRMQNEGRECRKCASHSFLCLRFFFICQDKLQLEHYLYKNIFVQLDLFM